MKIQKQLELEQRRDEREGQKGGRRRRPRIRLNKNTKKQRH
jgi:hypothetical protein